MLNPDYDDDTLTAAISHELRHVEQSLVTNNILASYSTEEAVALNRILEADASAYSVGVAFEIAQETGNTGPLDSLERNEGDIRDAFLQAVTPGRPVYEDASPFQAAFKAWFKNRDRVELYDQKALELYVHVKSSILSLLLFREAASLDKEAIANVGCLSENFNYLSGKTAPRVMAKKYTAPRSTKIQSLINSAQNLEMSCA